MVKNKYSDTEKMLKGNQPILYKDLIKQLSGKSKAIAKNLSYVELDDEYADSELVFIPIDGQYVVAWRKVEDYENIVYTNYHFLWHRATNSLVTLDDLAALPKDECRRFRTACKKNGWNLLLGIVEHKRKAKYNADTDEYSWYD